MAAPVRYTRQKQQELRSIPQIKERLVEFGWLPTRPEEDLGEDLHVHIYFEGKATGVLFHLQAKGVTNLHERRKDEFLPYPFKVKDLLHWEQFELPVVLMVWDVNLREGRWVLWNTAVLQLDRQNPKWREQKTATVYLPWQNGTDDEGLIGLRKGIGRFLFPQLSRGKDQKIEIKVKFPDNKERQANLAAYDHWLKTGQQVALKEVEDKFENPEWYELWFGKPTAEIGDLVLPSRSSSKINDVDISIKDNYGGTAFLPRVQLKAIEIGRSAIKLSNEHQATYPFHFCLHITNSSQLEAHTIQFTEGNISITQNNFGAHLEETRNLLKFAQCLANGGVITFTLSDLRYSFSITTYPEAEVAPSPQLVELIEKLYKIQEITRTQFRVPDEGFAERDQIEAIEETFSAFETGKVVTKYKRIKLALTGIQEEDLAVMIELCNQGEKISFILSYNESIYEVLDEIISLGRVTRFIVGKMSVGEIENAMQTIKPDQQISLSMVEVEIIDVFPDCYIKEAKRLVKLLAEKFKVEAVYLFGSLAWGEQWNPRTDIDLAVRGLAPEKFFKAIGYLEGETQFSFDFVDLKNVPDYLCERIVTRGKLLYER